MMRLVGAVRLMRVVRAVRAAKVVRAVGVAWAEPRWVVPCDNILVLYLGGVCLVLLLLLSRGLCSGRRPFRLLIEKMAVGIITG